MKKIVSLVMIFILLLGVVPVSQASAKDKKYYTWGDYRYEILKDGTVSIEEYTKNQEVVVIPNKINNRKVTGIGNDAFCYDVMKKMKLKKVTLPKYLRYVEDCAFSHCYKLETITFPPRPVKFGISVFYDCYPMKRINISNLKAWCNSSFGSSYSNPMRNGAELYLNGKRIRNLKIPDGVKTVRKFAFFYGNYEKITIPDSVTKILGKAFWCSSAKEIKIGNGVKFIGEMAFKGCYKAEKITMGKSVERIKKDAFRNCYSLKSITLPDGLKSLEVYAFDGCDKLEKINIPESVEIVRNGAFRDTKWYDKQPLGMIYINNVAYKYKGKCPAEYTIKEGTEYISDYAFNGQKTLKKIIMPDSVETTGDNAFYNCNNLQEVVFSQNLNSISDSAFKKCYKLENPVILDSVKSIEDYAFADCDEITDLTIGENVEFMGDGVLYGCDKLKSVTFNNNPKTIPAHFFNSCTSLEEFTLPDSVKTIGFKAFANCTNLKNLPVAKNVTKYGDSTFEGCTGFTEIIIPDNVTVIGREVFENCKNIETLTLHKGVKEVWYQSFANCRKLHTVNYNAENCYFLWLSDNNEEHNDVFEKCKRLKTINIGENVKRLPGDMLLNAVRNNLETINVPKSLKKIGYEKVDMNKKLVAKNSNNKEVIKVTKKSDIMLKSVGSAKVRFERKGKVKRVKINVY